MSIAGQKYPSINSNTVYTNITNGLKLGYVLIVGGKMEQQHYSHGLLYSVPPENFSSLHLQEEIRVDDFDWGEYESQLSGDSISKIILDFLKQTASHWGITKP